MPSDAQTPFRTYDVGTRVYNAGTASANQVPSGVFPGIGGMQVVASSGMNVLAQSGYCCIANSGSSLQGGYVFGLMTSQVFQVAASSGSPRIDAVVAYVSDLGTASSAAYVAIITGTPAAAPAVPALPANSLLLATVAVGAGVTSIVAGKITDQRSFVVAPGGILPVQSAAAAPAVPPSQFMYDIQAGQLVQGTGSAGSVAVPQTLKWVPQLAVVTGSITASGGGALTAVTSVSVTTDGSTDIEIYVKWAGVLGNAGDVELLLYIDGTQCDSVYAISLDGSNPTNGGSAKYYTSSAQGNTPSAGTHTIAWKFQAGEGGTSSTDGIYASSVAPALLRVAPVQT